MTDCGREAGNRLQWYGEDRQDRGNYKKSKVIVARKKPRLSTVLCTYAAWNAVF